MIGEIGRCGGPAAASSGQIARQGEGVLFELPHWLVGIRRCPGLDGGPGRVRIHEQTPDSAVGDDAIGRSTEAGQIAEILKHGEEGAGLGGEGRAVALGEGGDHELHGRCGLAPRRASGRGGDRR